MQWLAWLSFPGTNESMLTLRWFVLPQLLKTAAASGDLVAVALNTHGTRAVQKLIETLTNREQVRWQCSCHASCVALSVTVHTKNSCRRMTRSDGS